MTISEEFTNDARALAAALPDAIPPDAPTPLWKALDKAIGAFGRDSEDRRAILVLSDGKDSGVSPVTLTRDTWPGAGDARARVSKGTRSARDRSSIARATRT